MQPRSRPSPHTHCRPENPDPPLHVLTTATMSALHKSSSVFRRVINQSTQRRALAAAHEPQVTWAEYRSGQKSLAEWVDANRARVAFGFFVFYAGLGAWNLRPKGKKKPAEPKEQTQEQPQEQPQEQAPAAPPS